MLQKFDEVLRKRGYSTRSEAFRDALRDFIDEAEWDLDGGSNTLILTVLYDKETTRGELSMLQHRYGEIRTVLHTHIDDVNCLEIFVAGGSSSSLKHLIQKVRKIRGVKQLKFITTTSGV